MKTRTHLFFVLILIFGLILTSCATPDPAPLEEAAPMEEAAPAEAEAEAVAPPEEVEPTPEPTATEEPPPTNTPEPTATPEPTPTEIPTLEPLPPDPVDMEFQTEDMVVLKGRYYPAAVNPAPMIVLMHWAPGDMEDWNEIAFWLQNRDLAGTSPNVGQAPWLDPTWFPPMFDGQSFAVFTFTFRNCDGGCSAFSPDGWFLDAMAAMETAAGLDGVDPTQMTTFGASIGADGSPDACGPFNTAYDNGCLSALSLSPGSYFQIPYDSAVTELEQQDPPKPVWCFYAAGDVDSATACKSASGDLYQSFEWDGSRHGMMLLDPEVDPSAMELLLDFIKLTFGL